MLLADVSSDSLSKLVHREVLRFDDDLKCCATLSRENLYVCLTCGRCYSNTGKKSPLMEHFFKDFHTLVLRMSDLKAVLLPDMTEVSDTSFIRDVIFTARPHYSAETIAQVKDKMKDDVAGCHLLESRKPAPGRAAVIRMLGSVEPIRDFFLTHDFDASLVKEFSSFMKQLFNPFSGRNSVCISNLLRMLPDNDDPLFCLSYLLTELNKELGEPNVLNNIRIGLAVDTAKDESTNWDKKVSDVWMLPLDIQDSPLYRDGLEKEQVIPRVKIEDLTKRYDGSTITTTSLHGKVISRKYDVVRRPEYLILTLNRVRLNEFNKEKSPAHIILPFDRFEFAHSHYRLRSVISHEGSADTGTYVFFTLNPSSGHWIKCDTSVTQVIPEAVAASQCCILLFELIHT